MAANGKSNLIESKNHICEMNERNDNPNKIFEWFTIVDQIIIYKTL